MSVDKVYRKIHRFINDKEDRKVSEREMAEKIGCSLDTYNSHCRGSNQPKSVIQIMELLNMLDDDEIVVAVRKYKEE